MTNEMEIQIGALIRQKRIVRGMGQQDLGRSLGITFQQIQKYEKGINRVSTSRLMEILKVFGVSITDFIIELEARLEGVAKTEVVETSWTTKDISLLKEFSKYSTNAKRKILDAATILKEITNA